MLLNSLFNINLATSTFWSNNWGVLLIDDLQPYLRLFDKLLTPNGVVFISGPTENIFYKIGRKLAGNRFSGDYHVTNIHKIKDHFSQSMKVTTIKKLIFPLVLFEIFVANKIV